MASFAASGSDIDVDSHAPIVSGGENPSSNPPPIPRSHRTRKDVFVSSGPPPVVAGIATEEQETESRVDEAGQSFGSRDETTAQLVTGIKTEPRSTRQVTQRESASLLGSLLVHIAIILLIAMVVVPADLGATATYIIQLSLSEEDAFEDELSSSVQIAMADASLEPLALPDLEPEPVEVTPVPVRPSGGTGGGSDSSGEPGDGAASGASGSFFGIQATGHDFVYVLDRSGSMKGIRFRRAAQELVRSVESLHPSQKFYVLLFSNRTVQLFGDESWAPKPVYATRENKLKLARWLNNTGTSGGTDPRGALHLAMKMNPSAIFMLSDGEFNDDKKPAENVLFDGDSDTLSLVKTSMEKVPIHAIAYEDEASCRNMRQLADLTDGEYRFVQHERKSEKQLLELARAAAGQNDVQRRETQLWELVDEFELGRISGEGRNEYASMLLEVVDKTLEDGRTEDAISILQKAVNIASTAEFAEKQVALVDKILSRWKQVDDPGELFSIANHVMRLNKPQNQMPLIKNVAEQLIEAAEVEPIEAYRHLYNFRSRFRQFEVGKPCEEACQSIEARILANFRKLREDGDHFGALSEMKEVVVKTKGSALQSLAQRKYAHQIQEILSQARDLGLKRKLSEKEHVLEKLRDAIGDDSALRKHRSEFTRNEVQARQRMREARRVLRGNQDDRARRMLEKIRADFPMTITARDAQKELQQLSLDDAISDVTDEENVMLYIDSNKARIIQ